MASVFFPRPDDLQRVIHLAGEFDRIFDKVHFQASTETATDQMVVHLHGVLRQAGQPCRHCFGAGRHLDAQPQIASVLAHMNSAVHRLQASMGQKRHLVDHLELASRRGHCRANIAFAAGLDARLLRCRLDVLKHLRAGHIGVGARVPFDLQHTQALARSARMIGHHRHGVIGMQHLANTLDRQCWRRVDAIECAANHRAEHQCGDLHALGVYVYTEHGLAVDLVRGIGALGRGTDQREVLWIFQRNALGQRQPGRCVHQLAIAELASAGRVHDRALLRLAAVDRHAPLVRRRGHQQ
ncbi:hypothetical protein D3C86_1406710 [compost metagenome]